MTVLSGDDLGRASIGPVLAARFRVVAARSAQTTFAGWFDSEALRVLRARAEDAGALGESLARLALRAAAGGEFEIASAALDELLARAAVTVREVRRDVVGGWFVVGDHTVWIGSLAPLDASCSCGDFRTSALGACSHVLAAARDRDHVTHRAAPLVRWDPIRPLSGPGRWLDRVWSASLPVVRGSLRGAVAALAQVASRPRTVEPALGALVARELLRADLADLEAGAIDAALATLRQPLFPYQRDGVLRFFETGGLVVGDDMGLGKTAQAIAVCHVLHAVGRMRRALVIVPSPLKSQWAREWSRFSAQQPRLVQGGPAQRHAMYEAHEAILIASYEQLRRDAAVVGRFAPDIVILDEAQRIKNAGTKSAACAKALPSRWRLALTGTPLENRLDELVSIVEWVDDMALAPAWRLDAWHAMRRDGYRGTLGVRDLATIRARIEPVFVRRNRIDVIDQLPERRDTWIPVTLTTQQLLAHDALTRRIAALVRIAETRPLTREEQLRLMGLLVEQRLVCNGVALRRFEEMWPEIVGVTPTREAIAATYSPKLEALVELFERIVIAQRRKVVVFSQWRRMLQLAEWATSGVLGAAGVHGVYFTGEESPDRRTANLVRFHDRPDVRVLWSSDAGALGLNLQRAASCCVLLELPWNPAVVEQRVARVHRLGQDEPVDVYHLVSEGGIEARIAQRLDDKRALFAGVFGGAVDSVLYANASRTPWLLAIARDVARDVL